MLVLMFGLPKSGKTTVARKLNDNFFVLSQEEYLPEDFDSLSSNKKLTYRIAAWKLQKQKALDMLVENENVVFDSANAKFMGVIELVNCAAVNGHDIVLIEVDAPVDTCFERCNGELPQRILNEYVGNMNTSRKLYDTKVTCKYVVNGVGDQTETIDKINTWLRTTTQRK